ncbi:hypothetical protein [Streptomyces mirabilis]|uniref:hypothetical protein n=1 Tax=Streptomyces mirabilis TaxID=68239 RepID=UPI0036DE24B5
MTSIDERLVHETAAEYGVPGPVAQEFMARFRPCLYLVPHKKCLRPGGKASAPPHERAGSLHCRTGWTGLKGEHRSC